MATAVLSPQPAPLTLPSRLAANNGHVPSSHLGWLRPTPADTPLPEMRKRLAEDDYLFIKHLLPRSAVLDMRSQYFSQYTTTGLLDPSTPPSAGIFNPTASPASHLGIGGGDPTDTAELQILVDAHTRSPYRSFVAHPALRQMVRDLMDWDEEVLLTRTMLRHNVPGGLSTGVHYDKLFLRGGDAFFLTAWVPIGDIKHNGGGLIYLEDSVELGQAIEDDFTARAEHFTLEEKISAFNANMTATGILNDNPGEFERKHKHIAERVGREEKGYRWLMADYEAGDVVFHHPCSVHASGKNEDAEGRIRLSTDLRFYSKEEFEAGRADDRWMKYWTPGDGL